MSLLEIIRNEPSLPRRKLLSMGVIAGLSNASILAIVITAAQNISKEQSSFRMLVLFGLAIAIYATSQRHVFRITVDIFESIVETMRNRISDKIRQSDLIALEKLGKSEIYSRLTQGTSTVSQSTSIIVAGFQAGLIVIFSFFYIATLSLLALMLCSVLIVVGIWIYLRRQKDAVGMIRETSRLEVQFVSMINHLLDGFIEHKLNHNRSDDLFAETQSVSENLKNVKIKVMDILIANQIFSQYFMYIIMAVIVFILPRMVPSFHQDINQIAATLLFIIGPLGAVVNAFPAYTRVNLALIDIYELEGELDAHFASAPQPATETVPGFSSFTHLEMENIEFSYTDKEQRPVFSLGPIHFRVTAGETVFVIGGNGSGKSTLFKLMVGLYKPDHGNLKMNSQLVDAARLQSYREMFSSVFSDFHLFDRLYGLRGITTEQVDRWLDEMQLNNKTQFTNGRFSSLDLSSGQRKRLALIIALLEDRPVFVLDEWAAEQDPTFRRYFYTHILAVLKSRGKTVIAITHDEQYFHLADRVLKVDYGKIVETDRGAKKCGASPNPKENPTG